MFGIFCCIFRSISVRDYIFIIFFFCKKDKHLQRQMQCSNNKMCYKSATYNNIIQRMDTNIFRLVPWREKYHHGVKSFSSKFWIVQLISTNHISFRWKKACFVLGTFKNIEVVFLRVRLYKRTDFLKMRFAQVFILPKIRLILFEILFVLEPLWKL